MAGAPFAERWLIYTRQHAQSDATSFG